MLSADCLFIQLSASERLFTTREEFTVV